MMMPLDPTMHIDDMPEPIKVVNVIGTPGVVEKKVNTYLENGYKLGSELMAWQEPVTHTQLFVQQVILYEGEDDNGITTSRREN